MHDFGTKHEMELYLEYSCRLQSANASCGRREVEFVW